MPHVLPKQLYEKNLPKMTDSYTVYLPTVMVPYPDRTCRVGSELQEDVEGTTAIIYEFGVTPELLEKAGVCRVRLPLDWAALDHNPEYIEQTAKVINDLHDHGFQTVVTFKNAQSEYQSIPGVVCALPTDYAAAVSALVSLLDKIDTLDKVEIEIGNEPNTKPSQVVQPFFGCTVPEWASTPDDYFQAGYAFGEYIAYLYDHITAIPRYKDLKFIAGGLIYDNFTLHREYLNGMRLAIGVRNIDTSYHSYAYAADEALYPDGYVGDVALRKLADIEGWEDVFDISEATGETHITEANTNCKYLLGWNCGTEFQKRQAAYDARQALRGYAGIYKSVFFYSFFECDWEMAHLNDEDFNQAAHALAFLYQLLGQNESKYEISKHSSMSSDGIFEMHTFGIGSATLQVVWVNEPNPEYTYSIPVGTTLVTDELGTVLPYNAGDVVTLAHDTNLYIYNDPGDILNTTPPQLNED